MMRLLDFCKLSGSSVKEFEGNRKYIATGDVIDNQIKTYEIVDFKSKPSRANVEITENDILFAKMKDTRKVLIGNKDNIHNIYSTGFYALKTNEGINPKYIYYYLNSDSFNNQKDKNCSGATQKALNNDGLNKIMIKDIPDISTQNRIIRKLDNVILLISIKKNEIKKFDELIKSKFVEMFGDLETNPYNWEKTSIGKECYYIKDGPHKSLCDIGKENEGHPFISVRNIVNHSIDFSTAKYISDKDYKEARKKCSPEKGDILYSKGGTTGIAKLIDIDVEFANWVHLAVLKFDKTRLNGLFFENQLNNSYCYNQSQHLTKGIANRDLVLSSIAQIKICIPPIELQNKFAAIATKIDKQKFKCEKQLKKLEELQTSLMQEYFG